MFKLGMYVLLVVQSIDLYIHFGFGVFKQFILIYKFFYILLSLPSLVQNQIM
jgi:hypothetical protein